MRGKRVLELLQFLGGRIIPAHAGQTDALVASQISMPDHPRACGANEHLVAYRLTRHGSSPRMRGKLERIRGRPARRRIIPAHAGQTEASPHSPPKAADHPRACGANHDARTRRTRWAGSSPRMRGKPGRQRTQPHQRRIIPAHAGQTDGLTSDGSVVTDHPRACGANTVSVRDWNAPVGSSPRMRGKPASPPPTSSTRRIIPAHAGQTGRRSRAPPVTPDHPRACGANATSLVPKAMMAGSSPRMRGKRLVVRCVP